MHRFIFSCLILLSVSTSFSQTTSSVGVWLDHLPYNKGVDVVERDHLVYCATEQGLFTFDNREKVIERKSKVNGLSDVGLTCMGWSEKHQMLVIGYASGNVDLVQGDKVTNVPEIRLSGNYSGLKRINEIEIRGDFAYLCTNFGIVQYDLQTKIVRETFIIGSSGEPVAVYDLAFSDDSVHAATAQGLLEANLNSQLINFENWNKENKLGAPVNFVVYFDNKVFANVPQPPDLDSVFYKVGSQWVFASELLFISNVLDLRVDKGLLCLSNGFSSAAYKPGFELVFNLQGAQTGNVNFAARGAAVGADQQNYWVADGQGLYQGFKEGTGFFIFNHIPNAPAAQSVLQMFHDDEKMLVSPGEINDVWAPLFNNDGYYELTEYNWTNHSNSEFQNYKDIVAMISDPLDKSHYFASAYGSGILEFKNGNFVRIIDKNNSSIPPLTSGEHRIGGFATDMEGNVWFSNGLTERPLGVIRQDGSVETFSLGSAATSSTALKNIMYTSQDQIWLQTRSNGVVVVTFADGNMSVRKLTSVEGNGNLPNETVLSFAEDLDGEVWIGTGEGMAVLFSPQNIFEPNRNFDAQIIVIDEDDDGSGERVLGSEQINDIEVDGSNKKWFATATQGVFYTSENAKEQIYNFNTTNSPLPSDNVLDIEIDNITGMVYFATDQGIVSFQGRATRGAERHTEVFAYPNPVTPDYTGPILIRGLVTNAQVKIADIEGNIIFETVAEGGQALWSGLSFSGVRAKSGVYIAYITNDDGSQTEVAKILIVN